jgi:hypothetical protein
VRGFHITLKLGEAILDGQITAFPLIEPNPRLRREARFRRKLLVRLRIEPIHRLQVAVVEINELEDVKDVSATIGGKVPLS